MYIPCTMYIHNIRVNRHKSDCCILKVEKTRPTLPFYISKWAGVGESGMGVRRRWNRRGVRVEWLMLEGGMGEGRGWNWWGERIEWVRKEGGMGEGRWWNG